MKDWAGDAAWASSSFRERLERIFDYALSYSYQRSREKLSDKQKREAGGFRLNSTVMAAWQRTVESARILRSRAILFQCPARFTPTLENKFNLKAFFGEVRRGVGVGMGDTRENLTFVWEPRGEWELEQVRDLCEELELVHGVDPFAQQGTKKGLGYLRLHGRSG